jgi:hypothetical protein
VVVSPNLNYESKNDQKGDFKMSIMLDTPFSRTKYITNSKHVEPRTLSIFLISVAIIMAIVLLMYAGLSYTEGMMKQYSACRDKIIGYEQSGNYRSPEEFRLALSSCDSK